MLMQGCDFLTISPNLLEELKNSQQEVVKKLSAEEAKKLDIPRINVDEKSFRWQLNEVSYFEMMFAFDLNAPG
jgi:transaldolase